MGPIALIYDDDAYVVPRAGLMGRQVAGGAFLDAYLAHGRWEEMVAIVDRAGGAESLKRACAAHGSSRSRRRRLRIVEQAEFLERFGSSPPSRLIHAPGPPEARHAWARRHLGGDGFALCGVTHTLASAPAMGRLRDLLTAPFRPFDALICTSRAVEATVRSVTSEHAAYLADRFGGSPRLAVHLATIPLGVDTDAHRPATVEERRAARSAMGLDARFTVLCVGRLSHHAKAHPFPLYRGLSLAAGATGRPIRLILCGWSASAGITEAFRRGAAAFAPGVEVDIVDGTDPVARERAWSAADAFAMLADSVQETFGLAVLEAMARGLPVVASDWDGHKDTVVDGETGFLVPTWMVPGAAADAGARLDLGAVDYDMYLAEIGQVVAVDVPAAARALGRLVVDVALRAEMGGEGRRRAVERFGWSTIIGRYEELWAWQEAERSARAAVEPPIVGGRIGAPERVFEAYPTAWLSRETPLVAAPGAVDRLAALLDEPLTHHAAGRRVADASLLSALLGFAAVGRAAGELAEVLRESGVEADRSLATIAWLLKYDLLSRVPSAGEPGRDMAEISGSSYRSGLDE